VDAIWATRAALSHAELLQLLVGYVLLLLDCALAPRRLVLARGELMASLDHPLQHPTLRDELALLYGERTLGHARLPTHHYEGANLGCRA